ncbi:MAG TPA: MerR family transcriptional regulator [bacterium]|nr:MerR family transcriptional regulator [bacterium]
MANDEKLFYTIGEVAKLADVKPYVLRYWETEFPMLNPQKSVTGQRTYRKKDIQVALTIKRLLYEQKFTIAGAVKKLEELEKEGLDQIDLFAAKAGPEDGAPAAERPSLGLEMSDGAEDGELEPDEKLMELERLIGECGEILEKYR